MQEYLKNIAVKFSDPQTSEMGYRTDLENLLVKIFPKDKKYQIHHDAKAVGGNKPDFVILKDGVPLLYIEAKDIGVSLDKVEKSDQMDRYFGYNNLVLTDYVEFRFYRNGERYGEPVAISTFDKTYRTIVELSHNFSLLSKTIVDFAASHKEPIKRGKHLAQIMGGKAQRIRDNVKEMLVVTSDAYADLLKMRDVVKEHLVSSLDDESFADMYAQTLVYGLFAARYNDKTADNFSRAEARELVPKTNPFLRSFFDHIAGESFPDRLGFIVDELCEVFTHADVHRLMHEYFTQGKISGGVHTSPDPVIHFYEDFLREYDTKKKMEMGVFYTPRPVVQFIVRAVDSILKSEFGLEKGLTDTTKISVEKKETNEKGKEVKVQKEYHKVQVLDVATGTGTFLNEVITHIYSSFKGQEGGWPAYVENDLLPRLHGFELMMASYTIAHLKLGMTLHDTGAGGINKRLGVYLTNTLEEAKNSIWGNNSLFVGVQESITKEAIEASRVKSDYPIMCVIGNPPYSGISMNRHYTDNNVYKVEPGGLQKLQEKKNWLDDDYVKFIRFAESLVEKNGEGVVGMITAHGYIDNPTFRGMRWHLRKTFDKIYVIDLHGNSNKKETAPDGGKDENVFDIKTGVSMILAIKNSPDVKSKKLGQVYQTDFYGLRESKYERLDVESIESIKWNELPENTEVWRVEGKGKSEYQKGFSVAELFPKNTTGIVTMGDSFIVDKDKEILTKRVREFLYNNVLENELKFKYNLGKNYAKWVIDNKKKIQDDPSKIASLLYRPFDSRYTYFDKNLVWRTRDQVMIQLVNRENIAFIASRINRQASLGYFFVTKTLTDFHVLDNAQDSTSVFPLYLYDERGEKIPNINKAIWQKINELVGETIPENILDYVYAYLHSPNYRDKYKEFLKIDFPRVPFPKNKEEFWNLVPLGTKLRELHLMTSSECNKLITTYPVTGGDVVEKIKYEKEKVYINNTQYFGNVPKVAWDFYIGGYQPAQKWLKDRKDKKLSNEDIEHYQKMIVVLVETDRIMKEIDKTFEN
ncbi:MAG: type ISP restriction/modification enzyme [Candidatus Paceibacterota bacterium]